MSLKEILLEIDMADKIPVWLDVDTGRGPKNSVCFESIGVVVADIEKATMYDSFLACDFGE